MGESKKAVRDFMLCIALGFAIYIPLVCLAFSAVRKAMGTDVLLGALYGSAVMLLYYFLFARALVKASDEQEPEAAKKRIQAAYSLRMFLLAILMGAGVLLSSQLGIIHWLPMLASMLIPRISMAVWHIIQKAKGSPAEEKDGEQIDD